MTTSRLICAGLAFLANAAGAAAQPAPPLAAPPVMAPASAAQTPRFDYNRTLTWLQYPTEAELHAAYPKAGFESGKEGLAGVSCHVQGSGKLDDCRVTFENPEALGFGAAAVLLSNRFRLKPSKDVKNGRVAFVFTFPPSRAPPPPPPKPATAGGPPRARVSVVTNPDWAARPAASDIVAHVPERAIAARQSGRVRINCLVLAAGDLSNCQVIEELPGGYGFGQAALELSPFFRMRPPMRDGEPISGARITIPINFTIN